jgi:hypothetical protein
MVINLGKLTSDGKKGGVCAAPSAESPQHASRMMELPDCGVGLFS